MSFEYKNPTSSTEEPSPFSVTRSNDAGIIFSVNSVGGYMEVWSLEDLNWIIPPGTEGTVEYTGNTIPIRFNYNVPYDLPNDLTLYNDGISSGRRRKSNNISIYNTKL
jgi:hypothetical protein